MSSNGSPQSLYILIRGTHGYVSSDGKRDFIGVIKLRTFWEIAWFICMDPMQSQGSLQMGGRRCEM